MRVILLSEGKLKSELSDLHSQQPCLYCVDQRIYCHPARLPLCWSNQISFQKQPLGREGLMHTNAGCHHTGPMLSTRAPQHLAEDHHTRQEGHNSCTCPTFGSSSHTRQRAEIKVCFRSYQIRYFKELQQSGWAARRSRQHLNAPRPQWCCNVGIG